MVLDILTHTLVMVKHIAAVLVVVKRTAVGLVRIGPSMAEAVIELQL